MRKFLSGNEAFAEGVRLARPQVISAYPITPQTTVVEALASMVEEGSLSAEYLHVESEHTALAAAIGAAATGARTFTATSSQGLLYMAECLTYASGGRFPIVMMNANRALALPWNIYGDQRDSLSLLDHGWIQVYAENNQEALDLALMAYAVAEDPRVSLPVMVNVDGFALTHTYESVEVPTADEADAFLPPYRTANKFDFENPVNIGYSAGPDFNRYYQYWHHRDMLAVGAVVEEVEARFAEVFGRAYPGMVDAYLCEDADFVLVTLGSAAGLARDVADELRAAGKRAGVLLDFGFEFHGGLRLLTAWVKGEAASAGMVLMSRCQLAAPGQAEATLAHLNRALEACHCARRFAADTDALCKPWDALTDADMQRLDSCGHCQASYVKLHFDEHKAFTSLYFMELHLTLPQLQDAARALFADPACGHILRIKGFLQTVDGWCELNATRDTMHVEPIPDGQEVLIIIGEELDRSAIEAHIGQKTADQE